MRKLVDPKATEAALWMKSEVDLEGYLEQERAVEQIGKVFGDELTYWNENGNPAIRRDVLAEFRRLTEGTVVWERGERIWRLWTGPSVPGQRQVD